MKTITFHDAKMSINDLVGLKLPDALSLMVNLDAPVKVGAKDGTAFFYAGSVAGLWQNLDRISTEQFEKFDWLARKGEVILKRALRGFPRIPMRNRAMTVEDFIDEVKEKAERLGSSDMTLETLIEVGSWAKRVKDLRGTARTAKERLDAFTPLKERKVVEVFYADPVADKARPLVMVIDGCEHGDIWTVGESR